ncbi:MAG TPA: translation initiation factor IF-2 subunit alpha, partial [Methanocorpusculum sp.]|nr:translation initiation factor IF-2 subunit alpha [Methanocorpusculum sp.]
SLKDVNEHQRREKIQDWKNEQKAHKWIGFASEVSKVPAKEYEDAMYAEYASLYSAFEDIVLEPEKTLAKFDLSDEAKAALQKMAEENVKIQKVTISAILELISNKPDGVNIIRRALRSAAPKIDGAEIEILYLGAPNYRIKVTATDYKKAERALEKASDAAIGVMVRAEGTGKLIRKQK